MAYYAYKLEENKYEILSTKRSTADARICATLNQPNIHAALQTFLTLLGRKYEISVSKSTSSHIVFQVLTNENTPEETYSIAEPEFQHNDTEKEPIKISRKRKLK